MGMMKTGKIAVESSDIYICTNHNHQASNGPVVIVVVFIMQDSTIIVIIIFIVVLLIPYHIIPFNFYFHHEFSCHSHRQQEPYSSSIIFLAKSSREVNATVYIIYAMPPLSSSSPLLCVVCLFRVIKQSYHCTFTS
jgi:hypothetical protein